MTLQTQLVLRALLQEPSREQYGLQLCAETGLPSGTVYPIVARLSEDGAEQARAALARVYRPARMFGVPTLRPGELT